MSDPMTNTEVEDVLASIRRLVSDDKRPETEVETAPATDRLVLTPSLRVMDDASVETHVDDAPDEELYAETEDEIHADTEHEPDVDETEAHDMPLDLGDVSVETEEDVAPEPATDPQDVVQDEPMSGDADDAEAVDMSNMSIHDAFAQDVEEAEKVEEPETLQEDMHEDVRVEGLSAPDVLDDTDAVEAAPEEPASDDDVSPTLSDKIAALETLIGGRSDQFEPDDPGADAYAGTEPPAMAWEDAEDPAPTYAAYAETRPPEPEVEEADLTAQIFSNDEDVLDEEALRDLVSDIVRQELQGALGERITRNVRKLVRREIHRALAAQELE